MEILVQIIGILCLVPSLTSALHLEHNSQRLVEKDRRHLERPNFKDCPKGFARFQNSCFHVGHDLAIWPEAVVYCEVYGSHLAFIDSSEESQFVNAYLKNYSVSAAATDPARYFWIGGTDAVSENSWYWINVVRPIQFFNWGPGAPGNNDAGPSKHQDCLAIIGYTGTWDDGWCGTKHNFLCEMDLDVEGAIVG